MEWAKTIWEKLISRSRPKLNEREAVIIDAATEVANSPSDKDAKAMLRFHIKKLLADDPQISSEIANLLQKAEKSSTRTKVQIGDVHKTGGIHIDDSTVSSKKGNFVGRDQRIGNK